MKTKEIIQSIIEKYDANLTRELIEEKLAIAKDYLKQETKDIIVDNRNYKVTRAGIGPINSEFGRLFQINFNVSDFWKKYTVLTNCNLDSKNYLPIFQKELDVYLRIDSGCDPGQMYNDLMCDCREQLDSAIEEIAKSDQGLIIHIPAQDGRGKGTAFHLATLYLQEQLNIDTIESFSLIEGDSKEKNLDIRTYDGAIAVMKYLGLNEDFIINYGTNNPKKINPLIKEGFQLKRMPVIIPATKYTAHHLEAKKQILGHLL